VPIVLKSGSLNLLETSQPAQAGNGTALRFLMNFGDIKLELLRKNIPCKFRVAAIPTTKENLQKNRKPLQLIAL